MKEWFEISLMIPGKEFRQRFYKKLEEFSNLSYRNARNPWGDDMDMLITIKKRDGSCFSQADYLAVYKAVIQASNGMEYSIMPNMHQFFGENANKTSKESPCKQPEDKDR